MTSSGDPGTRRTRTILFSLFGHRGVLGVAAAAEGLQDNSHCKGNGCNYGSYGATWPSTRGSGVCMTWLPAGLDLRKEVVHASFFRTCLCLRRLDET